MDRSQGYIGKLEIVWEDGEKNIYDIAQREGFIWIGDHVVSPRNEKSMKGVVEEIAEIYSHPPRKIRQHRWVEMVDRLRFSKI